MKLRLPIAAVISLCLGLHLPTLGGDRVLPTAQEYAFVDAELVRTLTLIRRDLVALGDTDKFQQLTGIENTEVDGNGMYKLLRHEKKVSRIGLGEPRIAEGGCLIDAFFIAYDGESDPRAGNEERLARHYSYYQAKATGVPFAISCEVAADSTEAGKAFVKQVNELIEARLDDMKTQLGAVPVDLEGLIGPKPMPYDELEKQAFIVLEGGVIGHSAERYQETGQPERIKIKVSKVLGGRKGHEDWARKGEVISMDSWALKPVIDLPVGTGIRGHLDIGHTQGKDGVLRPFYIPAAPNGIQVTGHPKPEIKREK